MRILQICSARELGGGERHLADLANGLVQRGHELFAAVAPLSPLIAELTALSPENIIELSMRNALSVGAALKLARFAAANKIEIVHAHVARDYPLAAVVSGRANTRLVLTRHVLFPINRIHRLTLRRTARVIAVSEAVADSLRRQQIFDPDKVVLIPNGIDFDRFARAREVASARTSGRLQVGMIGHLAPIKGVEEFIRAAATICRQRTDVDFIIAGEDKSPLAENRRNYDELVRDLELSERVRMPGWIDDIAGLLTTFDVFVSPSRQEPFGLVIVEAMAAGVAVVATKSEGALEILEANQTGILVEIGDVDSLTGAVSSLLVDEERRKQLALNGMSVARTRFSLERMVADTEKVYQAMLALTA
jgi:L-malate glycosyltransferase